MHERRSCNHFPSLYAVSASTGGKPPGMLPHTYGKDEFLQEISFTLGLHHEDFVYGNLIIGRVFFLVI